MNQTINSCSVIESKATPPPLKTTCQAPNILLNFNKIKKFVEPELTKCPVCKENNRQLSDDFVYGLKHNIIIDCEICTKKYYQYCHLINNTNRMSSKNTITSKNKRALQKKFFKQKLKLHKHRKLMASQSTSKEAISMRDNTSQMEINLRAMLASIYVGTGPQDVENVLSFLGVPGGHS